MAGRAGFEPAYIPLNRRTPYHLAIDQGVFGRGRGIRTPGILLPKQARYQTALYPEIVVYFTHEPLRFLVGSLRNPHICLALSVIKQNRVACQYDTDSLFCGRIVLPES